MIDVIVSALVIVSVGATVNDDDSEYIIREGFNNREYMSDWNEWARRTGRLVLEPKCIDIPANLSLCYNVGYTQMRLPNLLEHETISEVIQQASSWKSLVNIHCHPDTKLFLCSLYSPVCLDRPIWPCRSLCEAVKSGCEARMRVYGFPWPEMFQCDKFPLDNDLCIRPQNDIKPDESICAPCSQPDTFEAIMDSYCRSQFAMRIAMKEHIVTGNDTRITRLKKKKILKRGDLTKKDLRDMTFYIPHGARCECNALNTNEKSQQLLIMGNKERGRLIVTHVQKYEKHSRSIRKSSRAMRSKSEDVCKEGLPVITDFKGKGKKSKGKKKKKAKDPENVGEEGNKKGKKDRKRKGGRNKKDKKSEEKGLLDFGMEKRGKERSGNSKRHRGKKNRRDFDGI